MLTRQDVFKLARSEHKDSGKIVKSLPETWNWGSRGEQDGHTIFYFGIYWKDNPEKLCVVSYGPKPIFEGSGFDLKVVAYDDSKYCCWAS